MMILERQGQSPEATQPVRKRRFPLDFPASIYRGNPSICASPGTRIRLHSAPRRDAAEISAATNSNAPLASLEGEALVRRFRTWNGRSGRRYICSVFAACREAPEAGLPDFVDAFVIAVGVTADGLRYPIAFFDYGDGSASHFDRRQGFLAGALAHSVQEWHVHLLATDPQHRHAVLADIERKGHGVAPLPPSDAQFKTAA
jgi:hypothetical protein